MVTGDAGDSDNLDCEKFRVNQISTIKTNKRTVHNNVDADLPDQKVNLFRIILFPPPWAIIVPLFYDFDKLQITFLS